MLELYPQNERSRNTYLSRLDSQSGMGDRPEVDERRVRPQAAPIAQQLAQRTGSVPAHNPSRDIGIIAGASRVNESETMACENVPAGGSSCLRREPVRQSTDPVQPIRRSDEEGRSKRHRQTSEEEQSSDVGDLDVVSGSSYAKPCSTTERMDYSRFVFRPPHLLS